jgi:hypothetical protein
LTSQTDNADNERSKAVRNFLIGGALLDASVEATALGRLGTASRTTKADREETLRGRDAVETSWFMIRSPGSFELLGNRIEGVLSSSIPVRWKEERAKAVPGIGNAREQRQPEGATY